MNWWKFLAYTLLFGILAISIANLVLQRILAKTVDDKLKAKEPVDRGGGDPVPDVEVQHEAVDPVPSSEDEFDEGFLSDEEDE